jgi:hypothetical protein
MTIKKARSQIFKHATATTHKILFLDFNGTNAICRHMPRHKNFTVVRYAILYDVLSELEEVEFYSQIYV